MTIGNRFLPHRVSIVRTVAVLDDADQPILDDYGQPTTATDTLATDVRAGIQPKNAREVAALSQAGAAVSSHTIYLLPIDVSTADVIVHDPGNCPMRTDLPSQTYEVDTVPDAAGAGHHLEINATLIGSAQSAYATPVGEGS